MCSTCNRLLLVVVLSFGFAALPALGQNTTVRYNIRAVPDDPSSQITWSVNLFLQVARTDGNNVAWSLYRVAISRLDAEQRAVCTWVDTLPTVNASEGLWWVLHADPENPVPAEFVLPPRIEGAATATTPRNVDITYYLEGSPYVAAPDGSLFATTAAISYAFCYVADPGPGENGEDEPVEVPPDSEPPVGLVHGRLAIPTCAFGPVPAARALT